MLSRHASPTDRTNSFKLTAAPSALYIGEGRTLPLLWAFRRNYSSASIYRRTELLLLYIGLRNFFFLFFYIAAREGRNYSGFSFFSIYKLGRMGLLFSITSSLYMSGGSFFIFSSAGGLQEALFVI